MCELKSAANRGRRRRMKAYHFQVNNTFWKARQATSCTPSISNVKGSHTIIRPSNSVHQGISFNGGESNIAAQGSRVRFWLSGLA